jgi:hypothetical protein
MTQPRDTTPVLNFLPQWRFWGKKAERCCLELTNPFSRKELIDVRRANHSPTRRYPSEVDEPCG